MLKSHHDKMMEKAMGVYQELEREYDTEIVEEFFSHYAFMTDALESLIIGLSHQEKYQANIQEIFRIFHNIKSSSGYLKITSLNKVVTLAEELLDECRHLQGPASDALVSWLLIVSDQLQRYREDFENDRETLSPIDHQIIKIPTHYLK